ncbi:MAG: TetR/AcrR family transcriptional regulator [Thermodesulfobacteriota bacterium]
MTVVKAKVQNADLVKKKHKKIVGVAGGLFSKQGFHKTSMRQIAEASGTELSYLYKYISSKHDILLLLYESLYERYSSILDVIEKKPEQDPAEQLIEVIELFFETSQGYYPETRATLMETRHLTKEHFKIVLQKEIEYANAFLKLIERGNKSGCFDVKDPLVSANFVVHMIEADIIRGWAYRKKRTPEEAKAEMIRFILQALGCCKC